MKNENLGKLAVETFQQRTGGKTLVCGICGGTGWGVEGTVTIPIQDNISKQIVLGGKMLPLISFTCEICGNTLFFNLIKLIGREKFEQAMKEEKVDAILEEIQKSMEVKEEGNGLTR